MKLLKTRILYCIAGLLICSGISVATEPPEDELKNWQNKYPDRAYISAVKKLDVTISVVDHNLEINQKSYQEIIVLADNTSSLAESKEYFNNHYKLNKFEAYTLVPDNKQYRKVPVPQYTRTIEIDDYIFYDDQLVYKYTYPAVGKGAKLVTRSDATTQYPYVPIVFNFGNALPEENMAVTLTFPRSVSISYHYFGLDTGIIRMNKEIKGDRVTYTWTADNSKVYEIDNLAPDSRYVIPHLIIQVASFQDNQIRKPVLGTLGDLYNYNFSHISNLSSEPAEEVKKMTDSITGVLTSDREKVRRIFQWVQQHIKYVAIEDGENGLVPSEAELVLKRRYGDCKGKTSLLVSMIRSAGLQASYAWVGSRERPYKYSEFPSVVNDDHMIAVWWESNKPVILDGTTFSHRMEDIPAFIQGKECLIEKGKDDFMLYSIPTAPATDNLIIDSLRVEIKGDSITGHGVALFRGENRADAIGAFEGKDISVYPKILQKLLPKASNKHLVHSVKVSDLYENDEVFRVDYDFSLPGYVTAANDNKYVSMNIDRYLNQIVMKEDRQIPVESEMALEYRLVCTLKVPSGYRLMQIPEKARFTNPLFGFNEEYSITDDLITLQSSVFLGFQIIHGPELQQFRQMLLQMNRNYLKSLTFEKIKSL